MTDRVQADSFCRQQQYWIYAAFHGEKPHLSSIGESPPKCSPGLAKLTVSSRAHSHRLSAIGNSRLEF